MGYNTKVYKKQGGAELVVSSGGKITVETGGKLMLGEVEMTMAGAAIADITATPAELNQYALTLDITDASAEAVYYVACPHAGNIAKIYSVIDSAALTADVTITAAIGVVAVTNGVITITQAGSAAGDVDVATPSGACTVTAGQAVNLTVSGGGSAGTGPRIHVTILITR